MALLLKPASSTPSNTGSPRSFQSDTKMAQRFCGAEKFYNEETQTSAYDAFGYCNAQRMQRAGNATRKGCIWLLSIVNSMHNSAKDRRWALFHSKIPTAEKTAFLTSLSSSLRCESAAEHHTTELCSKTGRTKLQKNLRRSDRS